MESEVSSCLLCSRPKHVQRPSAQQSSQEHAQRCASRKEPTETRPLRERACSTSLEPDPGRLPLQLLQFLVHLLRPFGMGRRLRRGMDLWRGRGRSEGGVAQGTHRRCRGPQWTAMGPGQGRSGTGVGWGRGAETQDPAAQATGLERVPRRGGGSGGLPLALLALVRMCLCVRARRVAWWLRPRRRPLHCPVLMD